MDDPTLIIRLYVVLLISLVVHEVAHGLVARWLGDRTASDAGLVTLNPAPHMRREPFGTVILPLVLLIMTQGNAFIGFAHVPIDAAWANKNPRKSALVALAGPLANFVLVAVAFAGLYWMVETGVADAWRPSDRLLQFVTPVDSDDETARAGALLLSDFLWMNVFLGVFNLMPWPPLDASVVLGGLFPKSLRPLFQSIATTPLLAMLGVIAIAMFVVGEIWAVIVNALAAAL